MNKKVVFRTSAGWFVRYEGSMAAEIVALFGTSTLPLPWTASATAEKVLSAVQMQTRKNGEDAEVVYAVNAPLSWVEVPGEVA